MRLGIAKKYKCWRHGRGYGVHSPFAFDLITRTLRERLPYYAYEYIDASCRGLDNTSLSPSKIRLLFRLIVRFKPEAVAIIGELNSNAERVAVKAAYSHIPIGSDPKAATLVFVNDDCDSTLLTDVKKECIYVFPDTRRGAAVSCDLLWAQVTRGMRFSNGRGMSIIVTSPSLPRQQLDVRF